MNFLFMVKGRQVHRYKYITFFPRWYVGLASLLQLLYIVIRSIGKRADLMHAVFAIEKVMNIVCLDDLSVPDDPFSHYKYQLPIHYDTYRYMFEYDRQLHDAILQRGRSLPKY